MALKEAADKVLERTRALVDNKESATIFEEKMEMLRHSVRRSIFAHKCDYSCQSQHRIPRMPVRVPILAPFLIASRCASCIDAKVDNRRFQSNREGCSERLDNQRCKIQICLVGDRT